MCWGSAKEAESTVGTSPNQLDRRAGADVTEVEDAPSEPLAVFTPSRACTQTVNTEIKPVGHVSGTFRGSFGSLAVTLQCVKKDCQMRRRQFNLDHHGAGNASIQRSADTSYMHGRYLYTHPNQNTQTQKACTPWSQGCSSWVQYCVCGWC